jgi:hypothetical protein
MRKFLRNSWGVWAGLGGWECCEDKEGVEDGKTRRIWNVEDAYTLFVLLVMVLEEISEQKSYGRKNDGRDAS